MRFISFILFLLSSISIFADASNEANCTPWVSFAKGHLSDSSLMAIQQTGVLPGMQSTEIEFKGTHQKATVGTSIKLEGYLPKTFLLVNAEKSNVSVELTPFRKTHSEGFLITDCGQKVAELERTFQSAGVRVQVIYTLKDSNGELLAISELADYFNPTVKWQTPNGEKIGTVRRGLPLVTGTIHSAELMRNYDYEMWLAFTALFFSSERSYL